MHTVSNRKLLQEGVRTGISFLRLECHVQSFLSELDQRNKNQWKNSKMPKWQIKDIGYHRRRHHRCLVGILVNIEVKVESQVTLVMPQVQMPPCAPLILYVEESSVFSWRKFLSPKGSQTWLYFSHIHPNITHKLKGASNNFYRHHGPNKMQLKRKLVYMGSIEDAIRLIQIAERLEKWLRQKISQRHQWWA